MANGNNGNGSKKTSLKNPKPWVPTDKFKAWVDLRLNPDNPLGMVRSCEEAGVHFTTIYEHLKKPEAVEYLNRRREELFKAYAPVIDTALMNKAIKGDIAAIRLFHEIYGDLKQSGSGEINIIVPQEIAHVGSSN